MLGTILLSSHLNEEKLVKAADEISGLCKKKFNLVIDSPGGDMKPTLDFVEFLWAGGARNLEGVKIYNAESAAAFIALSVTTYREMRKGATLGIHRGFVILEASEFNFEDGRITNESTRERFKKHEIHLKGVLDQCGLSADPKLIGKLYGSGWLRLSADECLKRGIVQQLF